ncbi:major facilitator superfamily domain-containing protein [Mucor lusitanicus]|uniref:Major facilitator superfamily domain-containing protein n=1 Tax=Mucor circinelloides f. lusitanicus TaxID=29924 RepID=A0A8H4EXR1_MUCCL|nr:major facilitator superfamily domain-containing protein [Mucor lusitanicus]
MSDHTKETILAENAHIERAIDQEEEDDLPSVVEPYSIFTKRKKAVIVGIASCSALFSPLSSNIYYPAIEVLQKDMHTTINMINLTITMYMVFQGISPSFWGSIADLWGRRPVFIATFFTYIAACIGLACSRNYVTLLILRMLQSFGSSSAIAVGAGTIGDISTPSERGGYMGILSMGMMLGPLIAFKGGVLTSQLGWRWIFWMLVIMASSVWIAQIFFLPETLRSLVGNGSGYANPTPTQFIRHHKKKEKEKQAVVINRPPKKSVLAVFRQMAKSLVYIKEKDVLCVLVCNSADFAGLHCVLSSIGPLFASVYGLDELTVGLTFLSPGFGAFLGSYASGKVMDWKFKQLAKAMGMTDLKRNDLDPEFPIEKARLSLAWYFGIGFNVLLVAYGWCLYYKVHMAIPIVINFALAFATALLFNVTSTILVDLFPKSSASVVALNNITRCFTAALAILSVAPGTEAIGVGLTFTIISIAILLSRTCLYIELKYGPIWRMQRKHRQDEVDRLMRAAATAQEHES